MTGALILLAITVVAGVILWLLDRLRASKETPSNVQSDVTKDNITDATDDNDSEECCGMHIVCEKDSLSPFTTEVEYYEDEELDRFAGKQPAEYSDTEIEEFRDILLTMLPSDIAGWSRSLQIRGIALPDPVRQEMLLIIAEQRKAALS